MASERIQRRIDSLLDEADLAIAGEDWPTVASRTRSVLAIDPANADAIAYLAAAERALGKAPSNLQDKTIEPASAENEPIYSVAPEAERRQLTVMFCDLQGSTALSQQLDPEVLRDVIRSYQEVCAGAVGRFEGHIAKYLGDGLLVYFGYPQAHEDDPQRAVRAGLAILQNMNSLNARLKSEKDLELVVRIGIHTGLVVAGEMGGGDTLEELAIVGETPNIAARIEGAALPNSVVVSDITANLIQGFFLYESLGPHELKGISEPVELFRVLEESGAQTRFEVATAARLTALVGREQEVGLLLDRWEQVEEGLGQVVLVSGEAGIGKSRLIEGLVERLADKAPIRWQLRCSAYHQTSTLHPLKEFLEIRLGFERDDLSEEKLAKLEDVLANSDEAPLLASLLSLSVDGRYNPLQLSPEGQKERTKEILAELLMETETGQPVLLVVEDLHWADPTTLEFLTFLVDQAPTTKLLAMFTFRPEFTQPWGSRAHLSQITLNRLSRRLANEMLAALTGGKEFPEEIVTQIATKSDGVPLFVEELARMVVESGLVLEVDGRYELSGPLPALAIPSTLQDSLTARLDRLSGVRETVQLAAVLGREFSHELIGVVSPLGDATLVQHLDHLVTSEFLYQRGVLPDASYTFKHALIQDAAYNSLLISRRQQYHQRTATALSEHLINTADAQPELLAHHYFEAGLTNEAVSYWLQAGEQALSQYAWEEALAHFERGLVARDVSLDADGGPAADREIAALLFGRGRAQAAARLEDWGKESIANMSQAFDYFAQSGDVDQAVAVATSVLHSAVGERTGTEDLVTKALSLTLPDSYHAGLLLSPYGRMLGLELGDYAGARKAFERALVIAEREGDRALKMRTLASSAHVSCFNLNFEEAVDYCRETIQLSPHADEPESEITAYHVASMSLWQIGDLHGAKQNAAAALSLAEKLRDSFWLSGAFWSNMICAYNEGNWQVARDFSDRGFEVSPTDSRNLLARLVMEYETGNFKAGNEYLDRLLEVTRITPPGPSYPHVATAIAIAATSRITGEEYRFNIAEGAAETALSSRHLTPLFARIARLALGLLAVIKGDPKAAEAHYLTLGPQWFMTGAISENRISGLMAWTMGEIHEAERHFEDALTFCRNRSYRPELAWVCCDYADMLTERQLNGDSAKASDLLDESLAISTELGMRPLMERAQTRLNNLGA